MTVEAGPVPSYEEPRGGHPSDRLGGDELDALQAKLRWRFRDRQLLRHALVHRSYRVEHPDLPSNERLEFLGDSVLGLAVARELYERFPELAEGELARIRASVVNRDVLAAVATEMELGRFVLLDKGEEASGGRTKSSILSDTLEAVLAAVYLDGGWEPAADLVTALLSTRIREAATGPSEQEYKNRLQELAARHYEQRPRYDVRDEGPEHRKRFFARVSLGGRVRGRGEGSSKKAAEQAAARTAWNWLRRRHRGSREERDVLVDGEVEEVDESADDGTGTDDA